MSTLQNMLDAQRAFQVMLGEAKGGGDPGEKCNPQYIRDMKDALESELDELQNETGWKPWATSRHVNVEAARGELVDAWHFFMNMMMALGMDASMLEQLYFEKLTRNYARHHFSTEYTGLNKCPGCKRAWDDIEAHRGLSKTYRYVTPSNQKVCSKSCWEENILPKVTQF